VQDAQKDGVTQKDAKRRGQVFYYQTQKDGKTGSGLSLSHQLMPYSPAWRAPSDLNLPEVFTTNKWGQTPKDTQFRCLTSFMCGRHPLPLRPLGQADAGLGRQYRHRRDTARPHRARDAGRRAHPHERAAVRPGAGAVRQRRSARGQPVRPAEPEPVQLCEQQPLGLYRPDGVFQALREEVELVAR